MAIDAGGPNPDAPPPAPDADGVTELTYDFQDGLREWVTSGCGLEIDPKDPTAANQVVCCDAGATADASFSLSLDSLDMSPVKHAEIEFRVLPVVPPSGGDGDFSPVAAATDDLDLEAESAVMNMNMYPNHSIAMVSVPANVFGVNSGPNAFDIGEWSTAKMVASTEEDCEISAAINVGAVNVAESKVPQQPHQRGDIRFLLLGIFRQNAGVTNTVRRCFDDIKVRFPPVCSSPE